MYFQGVGEGMPVDSAPACRDSEGTGGLPPLASHAFKTRLPCTANKACLRSKEAFFATQTRLLSADGMHGKQGYMYITVDNSLNAL